MKRKLSELSPLQRHAAFFDRDFDGSVTLGQTFRGLRSLGIQPFLSGVLALIVNGFLGYLTRTRPSLSISVRDIHRGVHPFDTGVFDAHGNLNEERFEALFAPQNAAAPYDRLTEAEIRRMMLLRGDPNKPFGVIESALASWFAARELEILFCIGADTTKALPSGEQLSAISRKNLRRFYEGRLFFVLERRRRIRDKLNLEA
jgi:peroxygenase